MNEFQKIGGSILLGKGSMDAILAQETVDGKRELEPLKSFSKAEKLPINILEDTNVVSEIEIHTNVGDMWHSLSGEVTFTLGGDPVDPKVKVNKDGTLNESEIRAERVIGGTELVLTPGDWLWIPPGVPHAHRCEGTARLIIIKVPQA